MGLRSRIAAWAIGRGVSDFLKHRTSIDKQNRRKIVEVVQQMLKPKSPKREPVIYGAIVSIAVAVGAAYGLELSAEELSITISTVIAIGSFVVRKFTTPVGR